MDTAMRCPQCHSVPCMVFEEGQIILTCHEHGHMAMGSSMDQAVYNWNLYISLSTHQEVA
jgi:hypothetical protein